MHRWILHIKDGEVEYIRRSRRGDDYIDRPPWFGSDARCFFCSADDELGALAAWLRWRGQQDA